MLRFAANLSMMYTEHPLPDRFAAAAADGFSAVEILFPYEFSPQDLASWLASCGLQQVLFNAPPGNWHAGERGLACLPGREADFKASLRTALVYARTLRCPRIHVMAGLRPSDVEHETLRQTYVSNLTWAAGLAAAANVTLLLEPINTRDMPGYFLNYQREAHAVVEEIGSPALRVQMDLYHCQIVEGEVSRQLQTYLQSPGNNVAHMQIASVPDRHEPDSGEVDYHQVFALIETLHYDGWIGCEYRPRGGTSEGLGWLRDRR